MPIVAIAAGIAVGVTITVAEGAVMYAFEKATDAALMRFGAFVWQRSRTSITPNKKPSRSGQPPHSHTKALGKSIRFAYDKPRRCVVIGPTPLPGKTGTAPAALEAGGSSQALRGAKIQTITVEPRPFIGPALVAETPNLPPLWQGSLRG